MRTRVQRSQRSRTATNRRKDETLKKTSASPAIGFDTILILDFGGQYSHLIARRVREQGVYSETVPCDVTAQEILDVKEALNVKGIILSGGPASVYTMDAPKFSPEILNLGIPILGLCYGYQLLAHLAGGRVEQSEKKEYGQTNVTIDKAVGILSGVERQERVWMSHGDTVVALPLEFEILAHTENSPIAAFRNQTGSINGLQWHPEVFHTEKGEMMLRNFLFLICGCKPNWTMGDFINRTLSTVKEQVGNGKCIVALSGGVDSSTAAIMVAQAIGKRLTAVFVDHGFMRLGEPEAVQEAFSRFNSDLLVVNQQDRFLEKLKGVSDPEKKREIIGREFVRVFEDVAKKVGAEYLVQGTIYPDRIESGYTKHSEKIKTHHNVAGMPTKIAFKAVIEPLKDLYKDEVRKVAEMLKLPKEIVWRQPFPGPGLAVRIIGEVTREKLNILKQADTIVTQEIENSNLAGELWQYFPVLTETMSVGVKGDSRAYGYTMAIRVVESREGMTAKFARLPYEILETISTRITNELPQVTRVVYDISNKPPATIEWE